MSFETGCQVEQGLASTFSDFGPSLEDCGTGLQGGGAGGLSYKSEGWQYGCGAESGALQDAYGLFQPAASQTTYQSLYDSTVAAVSPLPATLPDSPFSIKSTSSHQSGFHLGPAFDQPLPLSHQLPLDGANTPEAQNLGTRDAGNMLYMDKEEALSEHGEQLLKTTSLADFSVLSESRGRHGSTGDVWAFTSPERDLEGSPVSTVSTMGSSTPNFLTPGFEHHSLPSLMLPAMHSSPCLHSAQHTPLASDPSIPSDSPLSQSLSESIFEGVEMPDFCNAACGSLPQQQASPESFSIPVRLHAEALLPSGSIPDGLSEYTGMSPRIGASSRLLKTATPKARYVRSPTAKHICKVDPDEADYIPNRPKKSRAVTRAPRREARQVATDDALDYQPVERKTTAVTARGRTVKRLQLCEEDHSEDYLDNGNRRSKHHNPWTVEETEALVMGVESCGGGKWADIKKMGLRAIEKRSAVDLKDKWRNLQAALHRTKCDKKREIPASLLQRVKLLVPLTATKARAEVKPSAGRTLARHRDRASRQK